MKTLYFALQREEKVVLLANSVAKNRIQSVALQSEDVFKYFQEQSHYVLSEYPEIVKGYAKQEYLKKNKPDFSDVLFSPFWSNHLEFCRKTESVAATGLSTDELRTLQYTSVGIDVAIKKLPVTILYTVRILDNDQTILNHDDNLPNKTMLVNKEHKHKLTADIAQIENMTFFAEAYAEEFNKTCMGQSFKL